MYPSINKFILIFVANDCTLAIIFFSINNDFVKVWLKVSAVS